MERRVDAVGGAPGAVGGTHLKGESRAGQHAPVEDDRLPKRLGESWEAQREAFEADLRAQLEVPDEASVSLDGVMAPMKEMRASQRADGKRPRGRRGKVGCARCFHGRG